MLFLAFSVVVGIFPGVGEFSKTGMLVGYSTVAVLALAPLAILAGIDAPVIDIGTPSFVVFSASIAVLLVVLRPIWLVVRLHPEPTRQLVSDLRRYSPWLLTCLFLMFVIPQTLEWSGSLKQIIPRANPFWADPALISIDRALLFGRDAWEITDAVIPSALTPWIDRIYAIWHLVHGGLCMAMVLLMDRRLQLQAVLSLQLSWLLLGNLLATALSSVGPIFVADFWGRSDFAPMIEHLHAEGASGAIAAYDYLLTAQGTNAFGAGISAMPSMHVAIAVLLALFVRRSARKFQALAWAFVAVIYIGSIHLGWHYATDGVVSAAGVVFIWKATGAYVTWLGGRRSMLPPSHSDAPDHCSGQVTSPE